MEDGIQRPRKTCDTVSPSKSSPARPQETVTQRDGDTPESERPLPRYCVGIDLGTTNCVVASVDRWADPPVVQPFAVPQWVDLRVVESRSTLPSFYALLTAAQAQAVSSARRQSGTADDAEETSWLWQPAGPDVSPDAPAASGGSTDPAPDEPPGRVGEWARLEGLQSPGRQIASAKSWLSHEGVDRTADLLPWHAEPDVPRRSPMWASATYLAHLRAAWDAAHPDAPMAEQEVVITLPASFDEIARELTVRAAKTAGLPRIQLIEEPQAAFYAWLDRHRHDWHEHVQVGQLILVCDIGGGTTDLTLLRVRTASPQANPESGWQAESAEPDTSRSVQFHRVAVGRHLILGGDNMDLAVAKAAETKWEDTSGGQPLPAAQWQRLVAAARDAKETMLSADRPESLTLHLAGQGASVIGGGVDVTMTAADFDALIVDGFFPSVDLDTQPAAQQSGFQEIGLPYAADPAVTRHLAEFLRQHRHTGWQPEAGDSDRTDLVLFNGGVLSAPVIQQRLVDALSDWFGPANDGSAAAAEKGKPEQPASDWQPQVLQSPRLDLAVAQGAAYYALVRTGDLNEAQGGVRIAANLARTYFVQISHDPPKAICVIPADAEPGKSYRIDALPMTLHVGVPVVFPLWVSSTRLADQPGDVVDIDPQEMTALPPIQTVLQARRGKKSTGGGSPQAIDVVIETNLSEIGTVGLYCVSAASEDRAPRRWKMEFDIRSTLQTDMQSHSGQGESAGTVDEETLDACRNAIAAVFAPDRDGVKGSSAAKPSRLIKRLQSELELSRNQWPPMALRSFWQALMDHEPGRRISAAHESRWLNLVGFSLRPGYGVALDDWRTSQTWRALFGKIAHSDPQVRIESLILWRRIAGGLNGGQQVQLVSSIRKGLISGGRVEAAEAIEAWRLVGAMERLPIDLRADLIDEALTRIERGAKTPSLQAAIAWSIGRLASRQPIYGPLNLILPADSATRWLEKLLTSDRIAGGTDEVRQATGLAMTQMARRCNDRFRDVPPDTRQRVADWLHRHVDHPHWVQLVTDGGRLDGEEQAAVLGDSLPLGIALRT